MADLTHTGTVARAVLDGGRRLCRLEVADLLAPDARPDLTDVGAAAAVVALAVMSA